MLKKASRAGYEGLSGAGSSPGGSCRTARRCIPLCPCRWLHALHRGGGARPCICWLRHVPVQYIRIAAPPSCESLSDIVAQVELCDSSSKRFSGLQVPQVGPAMVHSTSQQQGVHLSEGPALLLAMHRLAVLQLPPGLLPAPLRPSQPAREAFFRTLPANPSAAPLSQPLEMLGSQLGVSSDAEAGSARSEGAAGHLACQASKKRSWQDWWSSLHTGSRMDAALREPNKPSWSNRWAAGKPAGPCMSSE